MQSQTSPHRKTRLASDYYYYQIHVNGPICMYAGYGEMVVTKTKGAQSCEVVKEKRGAEIETCISSSMSYLAAITTLLLHSCHKGLHISITRWHDPQIQ